MMASPQTRVLLLVEDSPGDAQLVREFLAGADGAHYEIVHVTRLSDALETLRAVPVDVVVLDLRLPDCSGVDGVKVVRETVGDVPIVVLTGTDDDKLALACIDAGAQDYLAKRETRAQNLKRAIGYAISRVREAQLRELQQTLERYRQMSSSSQKTTVTAAIAGTGAVSLRSPGVFEGLVRDYSALLEPPSGRRSERPDTPRVAMEQIVTRLGDSNGGPRDLLDVHVAALDRAILAQDDPAARFLVFEARLVALEMMGLLVDYYRVGQKRFSRG